jgi:hypothetical protein
MPAGQNHSNFALNTRLSAPRYDSWCKIQVVDKRKQFMILGGKKAGHVAQRAGYAVGDKTYCRRVDPGL